MPYHVDKSSQCDAAKPWAVKKTATGEVMGCHESKEAANAQIAALYANENKAAEALAVPQLFRDLTADIIVRKSQSGTRLTFAASSEMPVERFFGKEILSHDATAVRLERAQGGAMPLLFNHDFADIIGMVDSARLERGRMVVDAHLFDTPRAKEVGMMVEGGLRNVSIGYRLHTVEQEAKTEVYRATDWEPFETSIVTVPADATVGIGRSSEQFEVRMIRASDPTAQAATPKGIDMPEGNQAAAGQSADIQMGQDTGAQERLRIKTLQSLGRAHNIPENVVNEWVDGGTSSDEAAHKCLQVIAERARKTMKDTPAHLGLSPTEVKQYSITRAIKACVEKSWPKIAPYEAEISNAVAQRMGKTSGEHNFFVPLDVQWAASGGPNGRRDLIVGTSTDGGYLVGTNTQSFIELLRNRSVLMNLGATTMPGLVGSVSIPKQTGAATAYWFASEAGTATESNLTCGQLALQPKTVGGYVELSRQLLLQSTPNAEGIVNADLARVIALAVDAGGISGPGTGGEPQGLVGLTGLGTANPATGTAVSYADMISFQSAVAQSNAMMPGFAYVTTPAVAGILMAKPRFTNSDTPIWDGNILDGRVVGARAMSSNQLGSGQMIGGDFSQIIIGEWGVLEIEANPYAQFQAGIVGVRALYTVDVGVRYAEAFALGTGLAG